MYKKIERYIIVFLFLMPCLGWLFLPEKVPYIRDIWHLLSRPAFISRMGYLGIFTAIILILSLRLLKTGPI